MMEQNELIYQNNIGEEEIPTDPQITLPTHPLFTDPYLLNHIVSTSGTEKPKVPMPSTSNSNYSPKICLNTQLHTTSSITRGIPSILPLTSSKIPHTHTVVCYSSTCTTDQFIAGSCNNANPINLPIHTPSRPMYSEEKSFYDLSEETNILSPANEIHQSLEHSKTAAREHRAILPDEPDLQDPSREATEFLIQSLARNVRDMFAGIKTEMAEHRRLIHDISSRQTGSIYNPKTIHNANQNNMPKQFINSPQNHSNLNWPPSRDPHYQKIFQDSNESQDFRLSVGKAFRSILNAPSLKFDGEESLEYLPWKRSLEIETEDLQLTATQWLQLLDARTEGEPNAILKRLRIVQIESDPNNALRRAWESLNERYRTEHSPSQILLKDLTQGDALTQTNTQSLFAFSQNCESVLDLRQRIPHFLPELDEKTTLDVLIQRLDPYLHNKWLEHRVSNLDDLDTPSFIHFAQWIRKQAAISRYMSDTRPSQSHMDFSNNHQKQNAPKPASTSSDQKERCGSREYRDAVKRSRSPSPTPINNSNRSQTIPYSQNLSHL